MNIKLSNTIENYFIKSNSYYSMQSQNKFIEYFFPNNLIVNIDNNINNTKIYNSIIYDIQLDNNSHLDENKFNILICVENCSKHSHYKHYNKYNNFNNNKIKLYFYNHIDKCIITDTYMAIPVIYTQINYFINNYNIIKPSQLTKFNDKKFCLFISNNKYNDINKNIMKKYLQNIGVCENLDIYKKQIYNKSCYHSEELLTIFNKYKFICVAENSINDGYITEKIFNCLFAKCIPIYLGSHKIDYFFNKDCFINGNILINNINNNNTINLEIIKKNIIDLNKNEDKFNEIININKINSNYDDENYKDKLKMFIDNYIK
jgi:hypothetical protein